MISSTRNDGINQVEDDSSALEHCRPSSGSKKTAGVVILFCGLIKPRQRQHQFFKLLEIVRFFQGVPASSQLFHLCFKCIANLSLFRRQSAFFVASDEMPARGSLAIELVRVFSVWLWSITVKDFRPSSLRVAVVIEQGMFCGESTFRLVKIRRAARGEQPCLQQRRLTVPIDVRVEPADGLRHRFTEPAELNLIAVLRGADDDSSRRRESVHKRRRTRGAADKSNRAIDGSQKFGQVFRSDVRPAQIQTRRASVKSAVPDKDDPERFRGCDSSGRGDRCLKLLQRRFFVAGPNSTVPGICGLSRPILAIR